MLYETRFKWLLPALLFAAWIASACVVQPLQQLPAPADEAKTQMQATVRALRTQVAAQLQIAPEDVSVIDAEAVEWPDACLGAGSPQEGCALVVTPGYRITLAVNGHKYVIDASRRSIHAKSSTEAAMKRHRSPPSSNVRFSSIMAGRSRS